MEDLICMDLREVIITQEDIIKNWLKSLDVKDESTKLTYKSGIYRFGEYLKDNEVTSPTSDTVIAYKKYLMEKYSNSSVCLFLSIVKSFYSYLEEKGLYKDIAKKVKSPKVAKGFKKDIFTLEQIELILGNIDTSTLLGARDYALINLLLRCGLRTCEVYNADIGDIRNKDGEKVLYIQGKGRTEKDEFVVLTPTMLKIIDDYLKLRGSYTDNSPLFISVSDRNWGNRLSCMSIRWVVKERLRDVGIDSKRLTTHSWRHTAITLSLYGGAELTEVKDFARHEDINTTLLYVHNMGRMENAPEKKIEQVLNKKAS